MEEGESTVGKSTEVLMDFELFDALGRRPQRLQLREHSSTGGDGIGHFV